MRITPFRDLSGLEPDAFRLANSVHGMTLDVRRSMSRRAATAAFLALVLLVVLLPAAPAQALTGKVAILSTTVTGGASSLEAQRATALGLTVEIKTPLEWSQMTQADFASYEALILGDPTCSTTPSAAIGPAENNRAVWGPIVDGNVVVIGTDPAYHAQFGSRPGAGTLTQEGIGFAADIPGKTGMYITLSCYYHFASPNTPVPLLDAFTPGGFTTTGVGGLNDAHIVATHPALSGLTDADLSNWGNSVHEGFNSWASDFAVLAIGRHAGGAFTASDGSVGTPYILARGEGISASDINLQPPSASLAVGASHTLTATVSSGGTPVAGTVVTFNVTGGPHAGTTGTDTTDSNGQATFSYTGTSAGTDSVEASFTNGSGVTQTSNTATVEWTAPADTPPTVVIDTAAPSGDEGSAIALEATVTDDNGAMLEWTYTPSSGVDDGATCAFADPAAEDTTMTCTDDGVYTATLTADDGVNDPVSDSVEVTVGNVAPSITSVTGPGAPVATGTSVSIQAPFTDPGANDTHVCTIAWGDGTVDTIDPATSPCTGNHTYTAAGIYTVTVTVTDDDGGSDTEMYQYVVVYDPSAGFVTGGGWIDSPAGAYPADPLLTGKANFGFVSKYKKGANVPDGNTQFQFHAGNLKFHSTEYEWLVIAGPKAQYKGSGTINGAGDYGFMLTANDGQRSGGGDVDRFRIKIWDKSTDGIVYDNQTGGADDAAASDAVEGGSIVIHTKK